MKYEIKFKTRDISGSLQPCIFLFLFLLAGAFQAFAQDPFYLAHQNHTDKVLQVSNSSLSNGTPIVLGVRNDGNATLRSQQSWYYDNATQTIRLKANSNKCIARKGQQTLGDPIVLADVVAGSDLQKWVVEGNRIKLVANKLLGIGVGSQVFNVNTPVTLEELTTMTAAYECWYIRQVPSQSLTADGNLHRINSPGETFVDMYIPDPCPYQYLDIQARGGDGGVRTITNDALKAKGGGGATMGGMFKIGTGTGELKPGTNIRFIIGRGGDSIRKNVASVGAAGGGGTGVIAEVPGTRPEGFNYQPWELLLIAGGGGGAFSDCCLYHSDGLSANNDRAEIEYSATCGDAPCARDYDGWGGDSQNNMEDEDPHHGSGSGYKENSDPSKGGKYWNGEGEGFRYVGGMLFPVGGKNSFNGHSGGYGIGGGGAGFVNDVWEFYAGGGGGYSGGLTGYKAMHGGGGGGSFVKDEWIVPYSKVALRNPVTASTADGYVEYQFTNYGPVTQGLYLQADKGTQVEILKTNGWTLKWQYDCNLVLYQNGVAKWASGTNNKATALRFQGDGNLVIYNNGVAVWSSATANNQHGGKGGRKLVLTPAGSLFIVDQDDKAIWKGH